MLETLKDDNSAVSKHLELVIGFINKAQDIGDIFSSEISQKYFDDVFREGSRFILTSNIYSGFANEIVAQLNKYIRCNNSIDSLMILFLCANLLLENTIIMECLLTKNLFEDKSFCSDAYLIQRIKEDPNALYVLLNTFSSQRIFSQYSKPEPDHFRFFKVNKGLKFVSSFNLIDDSDERKILSKLYYQK
jgi:hypothetical protein